MYTRLLILSLIALLGLGSMEPAGVNAGSSGGIPPGQQKKLLDQQHQDLVQEEQTLAQTYSQLMDQKRSLLEQLRTLNPKGATTQDWLTLWEDYHQYKVTDKDELKANYKDILKALRAKGVDKHDFKSKVEALLQALEAVQQQQDALAQSWDTHDQKVQQLNIDQQNFNQQNGKN